MVGKNILDERNENKLAQAWCHLFDKQWASNYINTLSGKGMRCNKEGHTEHNHLR